VWTLINQTELGWDWLYSARGHPLLDVHISKIKGWALKFNIRFPTFFLRLANQAEKFIQSNNVLDGYSTFANI